MGIILIKDNIERVVETQAQAEMLKRQGFKPISPEPVKTETEEAKQLPELSKLTVKQLRTLAVERGISGAAGLSKSELLEVLEADK